MLIVMFSRNQYLFVVASCSCVQLRGYVVDFDIRDPGEYTLQVRRVMVGEGVPVALCHAFPVCVDERTRVPFCIRLESRGILAAKTRGRCLFLRQCWCPGVTGHWGYSCATALWTLCARL